MAPKTHKSKQGSDGDSTSATMIMPGLFLGPRSAAASYSFLTRNSIGVVLSVGSNPPPCKPPLPHIVYHRLSLLDSPEASIIPVIEKAGDIMVNVLGIPSVMPGVMTHEDRLGVDRALDADTRGARTDHAGIFGEQELVLQSGTPSALARSNAILVHCSAAVSRSPTVVAAFLMKYQNMTLLQALGLIITKRPSVCPNSGFLRQLQDLEVALYGEISLDIKELPRGKRDRVRIFLNSDSSELLPKVDEVGRM